MSKPSSAPLPTATKPEASISRRPAHRSKAAWLASIGPSKQRDFLESLSRTELIALAHDFRFWALPHQLPPPGNWRTWVVLGGRGAGKSRAGAEWVRSVVEGPRPSDPGRASRIALLGETIDQAREVMVFGESGILACSPPDRRPCWRSGRKLLEWQNGATAQVFSAHDPESLRGPQFDAAWLDELAKWPRAEAAWDMLQFALRRGEQPRQCVTTTPRNTAILRRILEASSTVNTWAPTRANPFLPRSFLSEVRARYGDTRLGRQELDGRLLAEAEGALWTTERLEALRVEAAPKLDRVVVAVDPPVTGHRRSDACGIVVAGAATAGPPETWQAFVLEDASVEAASPLEWAEAALAAYKRHDAQRLVAETNQGGDLVETVLRQVDPMVAYRGLHASRGKAARAEPVAALYEQGRVRHLRGLAALEDEMCLMTVRGFEGSRSPDRLDALVWALTDLLIVPAREYRRPRLRAL